MLLCRSGNQLTTTVYRKKTNNDIYLNWHAFAPASWKRGTLRTLVQRAYLVCSTEEYLKDELMHLKNVFHKKNNYPIYVINQVFKQVKEEYRKQNISNIENNEVNPVLISVNADEKHHQITIPYQDDKGDYFRGVCRILILLSQF